MPALLTRMCDPAELARRPASTAASTEAASLTSQADADGLASAPEAGGGRRGGVLVEVEDRDGGALLGEPLGGGGPDPARAPVTTATRPS